MGEVLVLETETVNVAVCLVLTKVGAAEMLAVREIEGGVGLGVGNGVGVGVGVGIEPPLLAP